MSGIFCLKGENEGPVREVNLDMFAEEAQDYIELPSTATTNGRSYGACNGDAEGWCIFMCVSRVVCYF